MTRASNWSRQHQSDEDFTRSAWDLARDAELTTGGVVRVHLWLSQQRGVWIASSAILVGVGSPQAGLLARTESSYPNARAASLAAFLFAQMNSLAQVGESAHADRMRNALRRV